MLHRKLYQAVLIISVIFAVMSWLADSLIDLAILDHGQPFELIPSDPNEIWLRVVICCLIVAFGIFARSHVNNEDECETGEDTYS